MNVLLVEDVKTMQLLVHSLLESLCSLHSVASLNEAEAELLKGSYSLVLLDVVLPDGDGFAFCEQLKSNERFKNLPVIFLTGKDEVDDRVRGFELGAEDYIVKPLEPKEFVARVQARLTRIAQAKNSDQFKKAEFKLDLVSQKAYLRDQPMELTPIEFKLLHLFLKGDGRIFPREELKKSIWSQSVHISDHTVDTHISSLRKKLGQLSILLKAVPKKGFVFSLENRL